MLYKFRDWDNRDHKKILTRNQIFFCRPSCFNDPFDCHIDENFSLFSKSELENYIRGQIRFRNLSDTYENRKKIKEEILNESFLEIRRKKNFEMQDKNIGVFSCNEDTKDQMGWQNILMWSHYANHHKGFCIGFDKNKTSEFLCSINITGGPVNYDIYPKIKPIVPELNNKHKISTAFIDVVSYKAENWHYENEYRFVKININNKINTGLKKQDRIEKLPDDCIVEITLGLETSKKNQKEIEKECIKRKIKLYQVEKKPFQFELTRTQIR